MDSTEIFIKMSRILADYLRLPPEEVTRESHVVNDLGADSLALVELGFKFMEAFDVGMIEPVDNLLKVGNLADHIAALKQD
jgi:acyl carrier protein